MKKRVPGKRGTNGNPTVVTTNKYPDEIRGFHGVHVVQVFTIFMLSLKKGKAIPVRGCETSRFPHFLDNRLTDGGEVSLTRRPPFTSQ
jgi:hypothetical protein